MHKARDRVRHYFIGAVLLNTEEGQYIGSLSLHGHQPQEADRDRLIFNGKDQNSPIWTSEVVRFKSESSTPEYHLKQWGDGQDYRPQAQNDPDDCKISINSELHGWDRALEKWTGLMPISASVDCQVSRKSHSSPSTQLSADSFPFTMPQSNVSQPRFFLPYLRSMRRAAFRAVAKMVF